MTNIDPHKYPGPLEDLEKQKMEQGGNSGVKIAIGIGLAMAIIGAAVAYLVYSEADPDIEDFLAEGGIASFVPIFFIVFFSIIASKKKKAKTPQKQAQIVISLVAGLIILGVAAMIFFLNK